MITALSTRLSLRITCVWIGIGVILMLANTVSSRILGAPELHPFFEWRLYSAPPGWDRADGGVDAFALYTQRSNGSWKPVRPAYAQLGFTQQQYAAQLDYLAAQREHPDALERLLFLAETVAESGRPVRLTIETYTPARAAAGLPPDTTHLERLDLSTR